MKAEISIPVALATAGVVYGIYQLASPPLADVRTVPADSPGDKHLAASERNALWASVAVAGAVSLVARDPVPFWFGGLLAVGLSWMHRTARMVDPATGSITAATATLGLGARRYTAQAIG